MNGRGRDTIFLQFVVEGTSADAQFFGGLLFVPTTVGQYIDELLFFGLGDGVA